MDAGRTPWDVLGVAEDVSFNELKRAYFRRARATHPDAPGGDAAAFRAVQAAFDSLQHRARRDVRPAPAARPRRPTGYDAWLTPTPVARQWIEDVVFDTSVAFATPSRRPTFADFLAAEMGRQPQAA
ncbi:MAG TPA: J domain-containing protein [Acidimicrobiales bacterium]|jgi:hypothetical protein|nr:J domain-containing protein [Acidimicrobiales bacterium]